MRHAPSNCASNPQAVPTQWTEWSTRNAGQRYQPGDLREASAAGDIAWVRQLLKAGCEPDAQDEKLAGWGPLLYAAQAGRADVLEALLDAGADVTQTDKKTGETALAQANYWRHTDCCELLAARGDNTQPPPPVAVELMNVVVPESSKPGDVVSVILEEGGERVQHTVVVPDGVGAGDVFQTTEHGLDSPDAWGQDNWMTLVCSTPETSAGRETVLTDVKMLEKMYEVQFQPASVINRSI